MADVRFSDLPPLGPSDIIQPADIFAMLHTDTNVLRQISAAELRLFVLSGGEATVIPPVINGPSAIVTITEAEEGTNRVDIPEFANKSFVLRRRGSGAMKPGIEYDVLQSGGFILKQPGDLLQDEEVFELELFTVTGGNNANPSTGGSFIRGYFPIAANQTLNANHLNQLIQLRGGSDVIFLTLPSVSDVPETSIIPIESLINNQRQHRIQTQGGQAIYCQNTSTDHLWIGKGEFIWLMSTADGWYPINYHGHFFNVGDISYGYKAKINQIPLDGSFYGKIDVPRLAEWAVTLGASIVSVAQWSLAEGVVNGRTVEEPNRGLFADDGGSIRVPDFTNKFIRALQPGSSSQGDRFSNVPGGVQDDMFRSHDHDLPADGIGGGGNRPSLTESANADEGFNGNNRTASTGGTETRPINIGLNAYINI